MSIIDPDTLSIVKQALHEDRALDDITTALMISHDISATGNFISKAEGILCGGPIAEIAFHEIDAKLDVDMVIKEGTQLQSGTIIGSVRGSAASILKGERTALNFLQHLSGIATTTSKYVGAVAGKPVKIVDTRKTTPGLRSLQKYAVRTGGGGNHRQNLADGILIKDNHIAALRSLKFSLSDIVHKALREAPYSTKIEIEVTSIAEAEEAIVAGAHIVLLDNMNLREIRAVVQLNRGRALLEASGGIDIQTVLSVADCGVDLISIGALTHHIFSLDISLDFEY